MPGFIDHLRAIAEAAIFKELGAKVSDSCFEILDSTAFQICSTEASFDSDWIVTDISFEYDDLIVQDEGTRLPMTFTARLRDDLESPIVDGTAVAVFDDAGTVTYHEVDVELRRD
jgi:hypothetical protein